MSAPAIGLDESTAILVPLVRFGAALHRRRIRRGDSLTALARSSERWLPDQLLQIELGRVPLVDDDVVALAELYHLTGRVVPRGDRIDLVLDRTASAEVMVPFGHERDDRSDGRSDDPSVDDALRRFLALAVVLGPIDRVPLRLSAAADALDVDIDDLVRRADALARDEAAVIRALGRELGSRVVVPEAGVQVAHTHQGTLLIISRADRRRSRRTSRPAGTLDRMLTD